jgi:hypothetical protein
MAAVGGGVGGRAARDWWPGGSGYHKVVAALHADVDTGSQS